jgi:hypothetical protein
MPLQKLQFRPGVNREGTTLSNEGGYFDCDKVRFRSGYPEKILLRLPLLAVHLHLPHHLPLRSGAWLSLCGTGLI